MIMMIIMIIMIIIKTRNNKAFLFIEGDYLFIAAPQCGLSRLLHWPLIERYLVIVMMIVTIMLIMNIVPI